MMFPKPELLAPVGSADGLICAVQGGADAVYLGTGAFNARQTAQQFGTETLRDAVRYCHARSVKVYVTLNTLVREDEIDAFCGDVERIARAGADAILVQDFGAARLIRAMAPEMPLHASTQMAVHNRAGVKFLARQGFARAVLAREMSLDEIRTCAGLGVELEVFVHGALCVSCSGQCLFSSLVGGRSGNRGRCAQPCRRLYRFEDREGYFLSTRDLCAIDRLDALRDAGVASLKIEGRLKRSEYVALVTRAYRDALDGKPYDVEALKQIYNRGGFTPGYLPGVCDAALMYAEQPNHLGVTVGRCLHNGRIVLERDVSEKDTLALRNAEGRTKPVSLFGRRGAAVACVDAKEGDALVRLTDDALMRKAQETAKGENRVKPLHASLRLRKGESAVLRVWDDANEAVACGETVQCAQKMPLSSERLMQQLQKTGNTPYVLAEIRIDADADAFIPVSAVNALRRDALEQFTSVTEPLPHAVATAARSACDFEEEARGLIVQSGSAAVLKQAQACGADGIAFAPEDVREEALETAAEALPERFALVLPCVLSQNSLEGLHRWALRHAERITDTYASNIAHFAFTWPGNLRADAMLHVMNRETAAQLREWGCISVTPSVELNAAQIRALRLPMERIVYGSMPLMQLRHCPMRAVHGMEGPHAACTRCDACAPERHINRQTLTDETGAAFPLRRIATPDGCILRLENSAKLMLLRKIKKIAPSRTWRILLDEEDPVEALVRLHKAALAGEDVRLHPDREAITRMKTTTGHEFRGVE